MPRRFRKNPEVSIVIVPGHGRVYDIDVLVGDHFAEYAPHLLYEVGVPPPAPVVVSVPAPAAAVVFRDALAQAEKDTVPVSDEPATMEPAPVDQPAPKKRGRPRKVPLPEPAPT